MRQLILWNGAGEISFIAPRGRARAILGPQGCGKKNLLRCIFGIERGITGVCLIDGKDSAALKPGERQQAAGFITAVSGEELECSVLEYILIASLGEKLVFKSPGRHQRLCAHEALERVGMLGLKDKRFSEITESERRLVTIASALSANPRLLLFDKPAKGLDFGGGQRVLSRMRALSREGYAVIFSTESPQEAYRYADDVVALKNGNVIASGAVGEVLTGELANNLFSIKLELVCKGGDNSRDCFPTMY